MTNNSSSEKSFQILRSNCGQADSVLDLHAAGRWIVIQRVRYMRLFIQYSNMNVLSKNNVYSEYLKMRISLFASTVWPLKRGFPVQKSQYVLLAQR